MANQNSAKTPPNLPLVINITQFKNSPSSDSEKWVDTTCIQYSSEANVIIVPDYVIVDSPAIKPLLEAVLDEGHIQHTLLRPLNSKLSCNMNRAFYYPEPSQYRGIIKCASDRFEAFAWENTTFLGSSGRPVYIGGYSSELEAARAHDLVSLRIGGASFKHTNFPIKNYWKEIDEMRSMSKREYIHLIRRRKAKGFSCSGCDFRGVVRTYGGSRQWQAWLGRDKLDLQSILLGTYLSAEDAGRAFDIAMIGFKGADAVTNFELTSYDVMGIMGRLPNHHSMSSSSTPHHQGSVSMVVETRDDNDHSGGGGGGNNNEDLDQQLLFGGTPPPPQLSNSTPSSSYQSNQTPTDDGLSGGFIGTASPLSTNSSSSTPFFRDCQQSPFDLGGFINGGGGATSQWSISSSSPSSSFEVHQNTNNGIQSSPCDLAGSVGNEYQHSNLSLSSSSNFLGGNRNSIDISCGIGGLSNAISQLNISPSSFDGYQNSNYIRSSSCNHGGLIATGYQQGNLSSLPCSFEGYQNSIINNNIQSSRFDFGGDISQPNISSPLPSSFGVHQDPNCIQGSSFNNVGGFIGTGFQQSCNLSLQPPPSFEGYQNSNSIQSSHCHHLGGTRAQSSDSSSLLSMIQQGYPNSSHTQSNSCNLGGLTGAGSSPASYSFLRGSQSSTGIQSNLSNLGGGATGARFQPGNQSSLVSSLQGYQSRPYDAVGRVIRPRSQLGLNSTRIQTSPYNLTTARSPLSSIPTTPTSSAQRTPFNIGDMTRSQGINMETLLSPPPSHNCHIPNNIQSCTHHHGSGGFTRTGSQVGNYGTSIGGNGALASNQKSESLLKSILLAPNQSQSQSQSRILNSEGNKDQNQIGSTSSGRLKELPSDFGKRLLGAGGNYTSAFNLRLPRMLTETSSPGPRAGGGAAAAAAANNNNNNNNNGGLGSFMLNSNNNVINNHVDVTPPPIIPQVSEPALPLQQQPALVVQSTHEQPNKLAANDLNPQNTDQNLNNDSSFSSLSPPSPFPESNARGSGGGFISEMLGNHDDDDFDITKYLDNAKMDQDFSSDVGAWLKMDVDEGL